jgi:hypothetical protein
MNVKEFEEWINNIPDGIIVVSDYESGDYRQITLEDQKMGGFLYYTFPINNQK